MAAHNYYDYAPYNRNRNLANDQMNVVLQDYADSYRFVTTHPATNGFRARVEAEQLIVNHLRTIIRIGQDPWSFQGQYHLFELYLEICRIREVSALGWEVVPQDMINV